MQENLEKVISEGQGFFHELVFLKDSTESYYRIRTVSS